MNNKLITQQIDEEVKLQGESTFASTACSSYLRELTSTLAHEISQPLMVISSYVSGCIRRLEEDIYDKDQIIDAMKAVNQQIQRAGTFIQRMNDCAPPIHLDYEKINIHHVIESAVSLITYELNHARFTVQYEFAENLPLLVIDQASIKLVMFYLLQNAIEEMSNATSKQPQLVIATMQINAKTILVSVKDNGKGISAEQENKLFHAGYTTKANHIGIGLAICRNIIKAHHGEMTAQSLPEGGACFSFILPLYATAECQTINSAA